MKRVILWVGVGAAATVVFAAGTLYARATAPEAPAIARKDAPAPKSVGTATPLWTEKKGGGLPDDAPVKMTSFARLAKEVSPAVVYIETNVSDDSGPWRPWSGGPERKGVGSGFIIHADGYILTNNHVIEDAEKITVRTFDDREFVAEAIGRDSKIDVALLKVTSKDPLPVVPLGDSDALEVGEWVIAIGNPFGYSHTVTAGIVSAKGRTDIMPGAPGHPPSPGYYSFIQTDAAISPGNSGGPLIDIKGEVIGINTAINAAAEGIAFAVPINVVKKMIPELKDRGFFARSWLGVHLESLTSTDADALGLPNPRGVRVTRVEDDSPASKAGLHTGDVVLAFEGEKIRNTEDLRFLAAHHGVGHDAKLDVWRDHKPVALKVTLEELPGDRGSPPPLGFSKEGKDGKGGKGDKGDKGRLPSGHYGFGIDATDLPADAALALGLTPGEGVFVRDVTSKSPAAGVLKPRDIVLRVGTKAGAGGTALRSAADFYARLEAFPDGTDVVLVIQRGSKRVFATFTKK